MGNCCGVQDHDSSSNQPSQSRGKQFQGQGHRLGSIDDNKEKSKTSVSPGDALLLASSHNDNDDDENIRQPKIDPTMTPEEREQQRLIRLAAAESRAKKHQPKKPKKKSSERLDGPNSKYSMTWTVGS